MRVIHTLPIALLAFGTACSTTADQAAISSVAAPMPQRSRPSPQRTRARPETTPR